MSGPQAGSVASPFRQPKAVFAVAFACVVSFMGIGLVDPILPAISHELHASPSQVTLLFTSYLVVTAVAMLVTNWVSSRIGAKKTLIAGLILIALGLTIFPVIGILMAVPVMGLAFGCFRPNAWTMARQSETDVDSNISEPLAA